NASTTAKTAIPFRIPMMASPDVRTSRIIPCLTRTDPLLRRLLLRDLDRLRVRNGLAIKSLVHGLPGVRIGIDVDIDAGRGQFLAIGRGAIDIDAPFLAFPRPDAAAEASVGLEDPGANHAVSVVLADHLHPGLDDLALFLDRVLAANECLVLVPFVDSG